MTVSQQIWSNVARQRDRILVLLDSILKTNVILYQQLLGVRLMCVFVTLFDIKYSKLFPISLETFLYFSLTAKGS